MLEAPSSCPNMHFISNTACPLKIRQVTGPLAAYYKLPLSQVLVFHDDMTLPCGVLRLYDKGGHGSHKGNATHRTSSSLLTDRLKSVIYHFRGNREFPRLRIGIGSPPGQMDPKAFLLQKFNLTARQRVSSSLTAKCTFGSHGSNCNGAPHVFYEVRDSLVALRGLTNFKYDSSSVACHIDEALQEGVDALKLLLSKGFAESAKRFNKEQKYKHLRVQNLPV
ncbi:hypothetical protein V8G54_004537 [Vigna mungo]|uniref:Peptidyl-tRNA hydrolase n=1 Tax=Vigna mungo TaxID=3915 RepID=A0AAQ3PCR3_VIGMU